MELHIVHNTVGGFAREDAHQSNIIAVLTDPDMAKKIALASQAKVTSLALDDIPIGISKNLIELGLIKS
jgi:hypothetical protein